MRPVLASMLFAVLLAGCRVPRPAVFGSRAVVHYDTAMARAETPGPLSAELVAKYGRTLAEPVSIVEGDDEGATWSILFASNRTSAVGTDPQPTPTYGSCRVALPIRPRGTLAVKRPSNALDRVIPVGWRNEETPKAEVHWTHRLESREFHAELRDRVERSPGRDVLLFVHGFNVGFEDALARTAQLGHDIPFNGPVVAYSWPSAAILDGYADDERASAESIPSFETFLRRLMAELPDARLNILVHSMGNRVVLGALAGIEPVPGRKPIANLVLAAPDVGVTDFADTAGHLTKLADRVTLYVCECDNALVASKSLHAGEQRIGDATPPVIVPGVETVDATTVDTSLLGHSYYGDNAHVLSDLFALLKEDRGAGDRPWLRREGPEGGAGHWVFADTPPDLRWTWHLGE